MLSVAKITLTETDALALASALEDCERLAALPVSLAEVPGAGWQVLVDFSEGGGREEAAALRKVARALFGKSAPTISVEDLPDVDWVARSLEGLAPVRAGRFLIHGSHDRRSRRANDIGIEIEAGQAFGTGHHGTTAGCLAAIDDLVRAHPVAKALDIGTGTGVLAIAIAKVAKAQVLANDIDPLAVRIAHENFRLNGVNRWARALPAADLGKKVFFAAGPYDLIVANILAEPLIGLAPQVSHRLADNGTLILSGLLPGQAARVVAVYRGLGLPLVRKSILDGWLTLVFRRGAPARKAAW